jgi:uncharacterized protein (TIGR02996 family)
MHDERMAMVHNCLEHPQDSAPRLVLSDWLEEHAFPRAGWLRILPILEGISLPDRIREDARRRTVQVRCEHRFTNSNGQAYSLMDEQGCVDYPPFLADRIIPRPSSGQHIPGRRALLRLYGIAVVRNVGRRHRYLGRSHYRNLCVAELHVCGALTDAERSRLAPVSRGPNDREEYHRNLDYVCWKLCFSSCGFLQAVIASRPQGRGKTTEDLEAHLSRAFDLADAFREVSSPYLPVTR